MLLILKSRPPDEPEKLPLKEKLRLILKQQIDEAKTDEDRRRAELELAKLTTSQSDSV
jgi:hypothetical protein